MLCIPNIKQVVLFRLSSSWEEIKLVKSNKALFRYLFFLIINLPVFLLAQETETTFSADSIIVSPDNIIEAAGNVQIENGNIFILAEEVKINKKLGTIEFSKIKEFYDGSSTKFDASKAIMKEDLSTGIFSAVNLLINETLKIQAGEVRLNEKGIQSVSNLDRITSCEVCADENPKWSFSASYAEMDSDSLYITYKNVMLRVKGVPVAYLPYLRLPDPSVSRARGFLAPEAIVTSNLGTGIKLPYFVPIGDSRDILITPFASVKTNTFEFRYRENFKHGDLKINAAISKDEFFKDELRYFYKIVGEFNLPSDVKLQLNFGQVSDDAYLGDYSYNLDSKLESKVILSKLFVDKSRHFQGKLAYVNDRSDDSALSQYYSIQGDYIKHIPQNLFLGNLY